MTTSHFTSGATGGPCWHCEKFGRMLPHGLALCAHPRYGHVRANPERGCCSFTRQPGADDRPGPPPADRDVLGRRVRAACRVPK